MNSINNFVRDIQPNKVYEDQYWNLVSTIYLFDNQKRVLLQLRDNNPNIMSPNVWGPVGGHCNYGETPYDCAKREFREETGYSCKKINWFGNFIFPYKNDLDHVVSTFWSIYDNSQKIKCYEGQKITFIKIVDLNDIKIGKKNLNILLSIYNKYKTFFNE